MLHRQNLVRVPGFQESIAQNATVMGDGTVIISGTLPRDHCYQVWRLQRCYLPLVELTVLGHFGRTHPGIAGRFLSLEALQLVLVGQLFVVAAVAEGAADFFLVAGDGIVQ